MNTKFKIRLLCLVLIMLLSPKNIFSQGDVSLSVSETSINQAIQALLDSKAINFGKYDGSYGVSQYNINISGASINLINSPTNNAQLSVSLTGRATFNLVLFSFSVNQNASFKLVGNVILNSQGQGYKLIFNPQSITDFTATGTFLDGLVQDYVNGFIKQIPEISFTSYSSLLPSIAAQYFTSGTPTLTVTDDAAILSLTLVAGPRNITAYNDVNGATDIGFVQDEEGTNNFVSYPSGKTFSWNTGTTQKLQTPADVLDNTSNGKNKYRNWFKVSDNSIQTDVAPRRIQLTVGANDETYKAKFDQAQRVQLSNYLIDAGVSAGTVTYQYSTGGQTSGGTFDDYDFNGGIGVASSSVPGEYNGFRYGFVNWSDGNTNRTRNIIVNSNINLTANYTKILYSSSSNATANNNQRKIAQTLDGAYFLVYERSNKIFLSKSADGINWETEVEVSAGTPYEICKSPSIVANENGNEIAVVWQGINSTFYGGGWDGSNIYFRLYNNTTGTWSSREELPWFVVSSSGYDATPVISRYGNTLDGSAYITCVVWREPSGLAVTTKQNGVWSSVAYIPNTNGNCLWPSITRRNSGIFAVCWQNNNADRIDYIEICAYGCGYNMSFSNVMQVSPSGWTMNQRPSISVNGDWTVIVTWQSFSNVTEGQSVHVREKLMGQNFSSTITSFSTSSANGAKPVIGSFLDLSSYYVLWEAEGSIYSTRGLGTTWTTPSIIASGSSGGTDISVVNRARTALRQIWKKSTGSIALYNSGLQKTSDGEKFVSYRLNKHVITYLDSIPALREKGYKGMIAFEIAGLSKQSFVGNKDVESQKDERKLRSGRITVNANTDVLKLAGAYYAKGLQLPEKSSPNEFSNLITVQLKDASTNEVVKEIWNVPLSRLTQAITTDGEFRTMDIPLSGMKGKDLYLDVSMADTSQPIFVNDYLILSKEEERLKKFFEEPLALPTEYSLHQNYPNPFNPTTTIQFDLIEPQHVILKVYNPLGQEVRELVNDYYDAGRYDIHFNASSLSSGVYFYRITAGEYIETKRLVLVK